MVWLTSQSVWVLVGGCLAIALLLAVGSVLAARALLPPADREGAHAVAAALMTAFAAAFAILTALTLSNEAGSLTSAQAIVSNEAADAARLAWAATGSNSTRVQVALLDYLHAARTYEWHGASSAIGADPATATALANLQRVVRAQAASPALGTPASDELLSSLDALTSDRRARLAAGSRELPGLYVITLVFTGVALIANAGVLTIRSSLRAAVLVGSLAAVAGLSMALLFALGTPWRGTIAVSGQPIDSVIHDLRAGFFHP
jgi:hypothetical protein